MARTACARVAVWSVNIHARVNPRRPFTRSRLSLARSIDTVAAASLRARAPPPYFTPTCRAVRTAIVGRLVFGKTRR